MTSVFKGRREDERLVTGRGRYSDDWNLPGQLHASFKRSDRSHGLICSVSTEAAGNSTGVVAVLTGNDIAAACKTPIILGGSIGFGSRQWLSPSGRWEPRHISAKSCKVACSSFVTSWDPHGSTSLRTRTKPSRRPIAKKLSQKSRRG